jgi:flagellar basal-body rod protein FlgB
MTINFKNAFDTHPKALSVWNKRTELLASNLANVDTPHYKARDLDFRAILTGAQAQTIPMQVTQPGHLGMRPEIDESALYRNPHQPSLDGNSVESEQEHLQYQASMTFLNERIVGLRSAIRGD